MSSWVTPIRVYTKDPWGAPERAQAKHNHIFIFEKENHPKCLQARI